jgi:hypothetical protein
MLLACNHVQAAFALITSEDPRVASKTTLLTAKNWKFFGWFPFRDWGNPQLVEIASRVSAWPLLAHVHTAGGYFKFLARRHSVPGSEWFWALEWNKAFRVFGAIYADSEDPPLFSKLPALDWHPFADGRSRYRKEVPLSEADDILFRE